MVVERVLQGWAVAVRDVERSHNGSDTDQDNLTPDGKIIKSSN